MMKFLFLFLLLPILSVAAGTEAQVGLYSNFIWRGVTFSENRPAIQANLDAEGPYAFYLATFISNAEFKDEYLEEEVTQEIDLIAGKRWFFKDLEVQLYYSRFTFPNASTIDSDEFNFQLKLNQYYLELSYMPEYFGYQSHYKYARVGLEHLIQKDLDVTLLVGYSDFETSKGVLLQRCFNPTCTTGSADTTAGSGSSDYFDVYLVGRKTFRKLRAEIGLNWTNRFEYTAEAGEVTKDRAEDFATVVAVVMPFEL